MAKLQAGIGNIVKGKGVASASTAASSKNSRKSAKTPTGNGRKQSNITPQDVVDIFNADLNRLKETFGPVQVQADTSGKLFVLLPGSLIVCRVCRVVCIKGEYFDLCSRHQGDLAQVLSNIVDKVIDGENGSIGRSD